MLMAVPWLCCLRFRLRRTVHRQEPNLRAIPDVILLDVIVDDGIDGIGAVASD